MKIMYFVLYPLKISNDMDTFLRKAFIKSIALQSFIKNDKIRTVQSISQNVSLFLTTSGYASSGLKGH